MGLRGHEASSPLIGSGQRPDVFSSPKGRSVLVTGAARTDNGPGPNAACLIWATAFRVG